jgi:riboflavin synthase
MFTGLIADRGVVASVEDTTGGVVLEVTSALASELGEGDSIAINGVCLTARSRTRQSFRADVMHETLRRSNLGELAPGAAVNLELPLPASGRLGGHIVQGHVDAVGTVSAMRPDGLATVLTATADPDLLRYVVEKGSVALDGVSLTVARVDETSFDVSLIPETMERTTLGLVEPGARVNLEVDVLAKHLEKLIEAFGVAGATRGAPDPIGAGGQA